MRELVADEGGATASGSIRVLIVDDEVNLRFAIERRLRNEGITTGAASSVRHAVERLRAEPYDVVLCDLRMPGGDGEELLRWLGSYSPSTKVIVLSGFITDEFKESFPENDHLRHAAKPADMDALVELIKEMGPRKGFYGTEIEVEFFDYVQMIALTGRDKLIEVQTPSGNGLIWFEHGDVVHVDYGEFRGERAFYQLVAVNRGTFMEAYWREPPKRTVQRSSTHLLMEAARLADEGALDEMAAEASAGPEPSPETANDEESFAALSGDDIILEEAEPEEEPAPAPRLVPKPRPIPAPPPVPGRPPAPSPVAGAETVVDPAEHAFAALEAEVPPAQPDVVAEGSGVLPMAESKPGHAIFEDPDTRQVMLEQFWQFDGINGVAIISSTGKVLAEDMRSNGSMVTLAGFYMRGAARLARTLGYNVFDGVVARSMNGQQMVMVSMGAASAVLSVESSHDPETVREAVMGVD